MNKTPFQLGGGVLTLGKESFPLQGAELEMLTIVEHENLLAYSAKLTNRTTLDIGYELSGKLISVQGRKGDKLTHACELDR